jgi:glutaredoxin-related protein
MDLNNKYASIEWIDLNNKELILTLLKPLKNIRSKIKILTYMSEWCPDCINQIYLLNKLSNDYKKYDLKMMIVMDYSKKRDSEKFIKNNNISIPFSFGELFEKDELLRLKTNFYKFRKTIDDNRKWGVPFHFLICESDISRVGIIKGEFKDEEIRSYILKNL